MTVNDPGFVVQAGDGRSVQIDAPNVIIPNQDEVIADEEEVDENYDPTFFLQSLPQQQTVIAFRVSKFEFRNSKFKVGVRKFKFRTSSSELRVPNSNSDL